MIKIYNFVYYKTILLKKQHSFKQRQQWPKIGTVQQTEKEVGDVLLNYIKSHDN